jgi:aryl-alcohol dehydrogenase-like predicted oxidoreductase
MLAGRATPEGTARYRDAAGAATGHFRQSPHGLWLSSLGIGTYLGRDDAKTDALYTASVRRALQTDAQRALQFARSAPGITCALVGMKTPAHVEENAALARVDPLSIRNQT